MSKNMSITKITIPLKKEDLSIEKIKPYLNDIINRFNENRRIIRGYYDYFCLAHPILSKVRTHNDTNVNNIVLIPDLRSMIEWKVGYTLGNPIKYAQNKMGDTDDIEYLNKYSRNVTQRAVDKEVATWVYATGLGYYFIEPKSEYFDIESEAPYELYCREADTCTKVYSAYGSKKPLFDILYTTYQEIVNNTKRTVEVYDLYFPDMLYTFEKRVGVSNLVQVRKASRIGGGTSIKEKPLPLVEKRANADGIGMVAMGRMLQNSVENLLSQGVDNVEDIVNSIFVYNNVSLGDTPEEMSERHQKMAKGGAIAITSNGDKEASVKVLTPTMSLAEIKSLYAILNEKFHAVMGVPMETSNTNSGGTTKQGSEVANGYENAYNKAMNDINTFLVADTELLNKIMWICKNTVGNKINNLSTSEIEIKYNINLTDNMLVKAQSFATLAQYLPPEMNLRINRISNDPEAEGKKIREWMEYLANQQNSQELVQKAQEQIGINSQE